MSRNPPPVAELPKGVNRVWNLPSPELGALWDSIVMDEQRKKQLLAQAVMNFTVRPKVARSVLPLHGVILLVGPPGTGKTTLAKGLAHQVSSQFKGASMRLLEVEPHQLTSAAMGSTQKSVSQLFAQSIAEAAMAAPTIVLLDEVETLAADRGKMSMDANPIDVHRATDAVLVQLDLLAEQHQNLLFVATSNFPKAVDSAFLSRCDLIMQVPLPGEDACEEILRQCLQGLGTSFKGIEKLAASKDLPKAAKACVGLDGRAIRKAVAAAIASSPQRAVHPQDLTFEELHAALEFAREHRTQGDVQ